MKKLKIKKSIEVTRKKRVRVRSKRIADSESLNYLFFEEEFSIGNPIASLFNFLSINGYRDYKKN